MTDVTVQDEPSDKTDLAVTGREQTLSGDIAFNQDIIISLGIRLPHLDKGPVKAYAARGSEGAPNNLFAMISEDHLTPRTSDISNYAVIINPSLARLIAWGPIDWAPTARQKFCLVFENTLGMPLKKDDTRGGLSLRQDVVIAGFIRPMLNVLTDLRDKDMTHGCIRLSNIFDGGSRTMERAILGEGLSVPASSYMPVLYEPIERALANPAGRGKGKLTDDMYAFGVCIAILMRTTDPLENMSDERILEMKMEEGSYAVVAGKDRFSSQILELLRGLLHDEEGERWTIEDIVEWFDGRRLTPKQAMRHRKAARPMLFNNHKYFQPEILAKDLYKNPAEARLVVENGELEQWIERALEDKPMMERLTKAVHLAEEGGKGTGYTERLVARVTIALYPEGPIRYKSINIMPDGIGVALTEAYIMKRDLQTYIDFFMAYLVTQWIDSQPNPISDATNLVTIYDSSRAYLRQKALGGGLERCIYSLNPDAPCLSPKVGKFYVRSSEELMRAYEKIAHAPGRPGLFMDRHIVAFLAAKDRRNIDPYLSDLNSELPYHRILAEMRVIANMQRRLQLERFPGIASWMIEMSEPLYERFHDRELRADIRSRAERIKEGGDLGKLVALFDTPATHNEDTVGFRRAMRKYYDLEAESVDLERELRDESRLGRAFGHQVAAMVAGGLALLILLAVAFSAFGHSDRFF